MPTTKWVPALLVAGTLWLASGEAHAQVSFAGEGRAGVTFPLGDLADDGAEAGLSVGAELQANFNTNLAAYLGLYRHAFGCGDDCSLGDSPRSTGVVAGLKYVFHNPGDVFVWGRGGIVGNTLGNDDGSSDREIGFELGFGADMPIAERILLVPNLGFVSHSAGGEATASFVTLGLGLRYRIN